jgi:Lhr-like helicase
MSDCVLKSQIYKYSSSKLLTLLEVLKSAMPKEEVNVVSDDHNADEPSEEDMMNILATKTKKTKFCTIVFVERRFTAKILYTVLKVTVLLCGAHFI